jgi:hypothetical protein
MLGGIQARKRNHLLSIDAVIAPARAGAEQAAEKVTNAEKPILGG